MANSTERPKTDSKKIHHSKAFELCYLRHRYLRKTTKNPSKEEMIPYKGIISSQSHKTYQNYQEILRLVAFDTEDLISIGNVHLVSFLGLFAVESNQSNLEAFTSLFFKKEGIDPTEEDILDRNKAMFTMFLKQRFDDTVRICGQKGRNIKGLYTESYHVFCGPEKPPLVLANLIKGYEKLGFKKISLQVFKSIRKKVKDKHNSIFQFNGLWYVCVSVDQKELRLVDFCSAGQDPYDNIHNMDPETFYESQFWKDKQKEFDKSGRLGKLNKLREFIKSHKEDPSYESEISTAKRILRELGAAVG